MTSGARGGLAPLGAEHPRVNVYVADSDAKLNAVRYIIPGLSDAGDKIVGTK